MQLMSSVLKSYESRNEQRWLQKLVCCLYNDFSLIRQIFQF